MVVDWEASYLAMFIRNLQLLPILTLAHPARDADMCIFANEIYHKLLDLHQRCRVRQLSDRPGDVVSFIGILYRKAKLVH